MKRLLLPILMVLALAVSAAENKEEGVPSKVDSADVWKETKESIDAVTVKVRQERNELVGKAQKECAPSQDQRVFVPRVVSVVVQCA